jgi:SNF2 family DNA or RNA helicase
MPATVVGEITADRSSIILVATGTDYEIADAARKVQTLTPLIKTTVPAGALTLPATWPAVVQLSATFGARWRPGPALTGWIAEQVRSRVPETPELAAPLPDRLVPRGYQVEGACLIRALGSVLLFDDQGTGKTITTILGLVERAAAGHRVLPVLVVCPAAVVDSWVEHVHRWAPQWRAIAWRGTPKQRAALIGSAHVYVCSYGTARVDAAEGNERRAPLMAIHAVTVVADEVHKLKAQATGQSRAVRRLAGKATNFVGLSGTPITHHPGDLWPALYALEPGAYPSRERWLARYCRTLPGDYSATVLGLNPQAEPEFRATLVGQYRRIAKADVLTELPPKVYSVRTVELPPAYRAAYDGLEENMLAELPDGGELSVMTVLAQLTRLAQLACAAADIHTTTAVVKDPETGLLVTQTHQKVTLKAPSWKVDALLEILDERPGKQVIAFAPSQQLVVLAGRAAQHAGLRIGYVMGGQTARERTANVDAFQRGDLDLICVTTGAGGVGLTLTAASTVVFLQRPWSLVEALQSEDRAHRIGSEVHSSIEIIDVVARNTIDSRVRSVLRERADQLAHLVQDRRIVAQLLGGDQRQAAPKKAAA